MKRALLVATVFACGRADRATTPRPATPVPPEPERKRVLEPGALVDRSIASIWGSDESREPHVQAPLGPAISIEPPEPELIAHPVPRPRAQRAGRRAPCFAHRDVLVGSEIWRDLVQYAVGMSSDDPPKGRYGTCTIEHGQLRDARGTLLAELHCGITVYVQGIIDDLGFEVGARGKDIAGEYPHHDMLCWGDDDKHTRCWFTDEQAADSGSHYVLDALAANLPDLEPLRGDAARDFFVSHAVTRFTVRMTCH